MSAVRRATEVLLCALVLGFFLMLPLDLVSAMLLGRFLGPEGQMLTEMVYRRGAFGGFVGYAITLLWLLVLPLWLVTGGATSNLWNWLPPFWPWGKTVKGALGRSVIVVLLELATIWAAIASIR